MIRIKGLNKFFNKGRPNELHVLNDIDLDLPERGMVAIFGKSGCGKTTLLNVIGGLDGFASGTLTVGNESILADTDVMRNKYIGYIFQNYNLNKEESCFDNVADALRLCGVTDEKIIKSRVTAALSGVGMEKYAKRTPDTLSGGQQQRIAIARAIVKSPRIILADEPTGNLDEANTVLVMDLLKAVAKEHLVLLVTHEEKLVDHYCDTVIELRDGKVVSTRQNASAGGYAARDKNHIFLGELNHRRLSEETALVEYYGEVPAKPIKLRIVNHRGKLYLRVDTEGIQILDEHSEIKLREGIYEERKPENGEERHIDMSSLPLPEGTRFGHLFSLRSSVKSGYTANFKGHKKSKRILRGCMSLFAAVMVLMTASVGTIFGNLINAKQAYNHNVFYVYTPNAQVSAKLNDAVGRNETGIDYLRLMSNYPGGDSTVSFRPGTFETFDKYDYENTFYTNAVYLDASLTADMTLVAGKKTPLATDEILITTRVADALLERSTLGYISSREDLIGLVSGTLSVDGQFPRIAGIVEAEEPAVYLSALAMAKHLRGCGVAPYTALASDYGLTVASGEAILAIRNEREGTEYPGVGETVKIQGRDIKVVSIKYFYSTYTAWLAANGIEKKEEYIFFADRVKAEHPALTEGSDEFKQAVEEQAQTHFYEYYDYFYAETEAYYKDYVLFDTNSLEVWLYAVKGVEAAKYSLLPDDYYKAAVYKERYGRYPTQEELRQKSDALPDVYDALKPYLMLYEEEFYSDTAGTSGIYLNSYMVSETDYVAFSKQLGESHPTATDGGVESRHDKDVPIADDTLYYGTVYYTVLHSADPAKTEAWLSTAFPTLSAPFSYAEAIVTPSALFDAIIEDQIGDMITGLVTMAVILLLMSLCMYFIMRSSLLNRIKEVGIYRAIGVSKRNLVFKFFIEAIVLTTLTVLVGYLLTGGFLLLCLSLSAAVAEVFFYPLWLAVIVLLLLYAISLFFGTLPILALLRKTPSEILSKYDI